ncbi:hypothetical protein A2U01_0093727, partial [Trifolium medium]|nr:hypothetical protein [Trifolium medium]
SKTDFASAGPATAVASQARPVAGLQGVPYGFCEAWHGHGQVS